MTRFLNILYPLLVTVSLLSSDQIRADVPWAAGNGISGQQLNISLVTIDPGSELTMWWGHTAVVVTDTVSRVSRFYNYGLFSFEQENFVMNFVQGRLIFWVGASETLRALHYYRSLNRSIRIQHLHLSAEKKLEMAQFLANNVKPENREYLYDHYRDNCATRVRDLIDKMVEGQFFEANRGSGRMTFRQHTRRHTYQSLLMDWLLMFLMSDTIDEPIRRWDEMFLPTELERDLQNFRYMDETGRSVPIVSRSEIFFEAADRVPVPEHAPSYTLWFFLAAVIFALPIFILLVLPGIHRVMTGITYTMFGLVFGFLGLVLFLLSQFTDHTVTFGNENLFFANPLTLLLFVFGLAFLFNWQRITKRARIFVFVLNIFAWIGLLLKLFFNFNQDNWLAVATILPVLSAFALFWILSPLFKNRTKTSES